MPKGDSRYFPCFDLEQSLARASGTPIAGVDEAGRGPWAGPVVAAAAILDPNNIPDGLNDSKKLTPNERDRLFDIIQATAKIAVGIVNVGEIDRRNILQATLLAMREAVLGLPLSPAGVLIDGNKCPDLPCPAHAIVKGDGRSFSIAAASIIAKVTRDRIMVRLAAEYPGYGWERNKGYGTPEHRTALARLGVTIHHRRSFRPVQHALASLNAGSSG